MGLRRILAHPPHTAIVHFPMALCTVVVAWDLLWLVTGDPVWWTVAFHCLAAGLVASVPAAVSGLVELVKIPSDHAAQATATRHMLVTGSGLGIALASALLRARPDLAGSLAEPLAVGLGALAAAVIGAGGWLGGELVLRYGVGAIEE